MAYLEEDMISERLARFRRGLILGSALTLGVSIASWQNPALAAVREKGFAEGVPSVTGDARVSEAIVVAENDGDNNGDDNKHKGKNANRDKGDDTMVGGTGADSKTGANPSRCR